MNEIHAYKNPDGTYNVEMISETKNYDGTPVNAHIRIDNARIDIEFDVETSDGCYMVFTNKKEHLAEEIK